MEKKKEEMVEHSPPKDQALDSGSVDPFNGSKPPNLPLGASVEQNSKISDENFDENFSLSDPQCDNVNDYNVCVGITYNLVWIYLDFSKGH
jgi:hypothetical protein